VSIPGGTYTITVSGLNSTTGNYTLTPLLNAAVESEQFGGPTDNTTATAQDLNGAINLGGVSRRRCSGAISATSRNRTTTPF
jgi:hypothetical protein